jgi:hypothetical protein
MRVSPFRYAATLCVVVCAVRISYAASPRDEILRLIPDDSGLCILVQDLRGAAERIQQSPFAKALANSPIGRAWRDAPEARKLAELDQQLRTHLNISAVQLRDDILGDAFALAVTPGPPGKPEQDQGLLLVHARNPQRLAELINRLNDLQQKSGEIEGVEVREMAGRKYRVRKKKDGDEFYWLHESLFAFSDSEAQIQKVLERYQQTPPLADVPPTSLHRLRELGIEQNLFVLWVNPRRFDAAIDEKLKTVQGTEAATLKNFASVWRALDAAAFSVRLDRELSMSVSLQARSADLPATLRDSLQELGQPAKLWSAFPSDALFVAVCRSPWSPTQTTPQKPWQDLFDQGVGAAIARRLLGEILTQIGPEFGVCMAPPDAGGTTWAPTLTVAMQWRSPVDQNLLARLDAFLQLVVAGINAQQSVRWQLQTESQGEIDVRTLDSDPVLPSGFRPSIAWKGGFLVLASSPKAIGQFNPPVEAPVKPRDSDVPVMRLAVGNWAKYLRTHREPIAQFAAKSNNLTLDDVQRRLDRLLESLDLFEAVVVSHRTDSDRATITLQVQTSKPMASADKKPH